MAEKPMLGGCCVCLDERGWAENPLVYCDGQSCNVAVHQACYGIVKVPSGPWFCRKCESQERAAKVKCELCPHRDGALKRTDGGGWAHVVCALYIPEVTFGSVSSMEPIILFKVPPERFNKTCYICEENSRSSKANMGACMTCAKQGCKSSFHVTCAQMSGLLCEEASGGNQTKYCGYCKGHLAKVKKISSYKSLSCTKVYKLPTTSSSDELTSPERIQELGSEASIMKPGDIRYTKAGKKRSKSLEESQNIQSQNVGGKVRTSTTSISTSSVMTEPPSSSGATPSTAKQYIQTSTVPIVSVEPLSITPGNTLYSPNSNAKTNERKAVTNEVQMKDTRAGPGGTTSQIVPSGGAVAPPPIEKPHGLTLSSLAEAASALSSADAMEDTGPAENPKPNAENTLKKSKSSSKDSSHKSKKEGKKSAKQKNKKEEHGKMKKKESKRNHNVNPHKPVPPAKTKTTTDGGGIANFPRHGVVSLAEMGMDRTETYGPHEIGDNNKIITPNMSVDGVTALERLLEEQKSDTMEFFREYGTTPDVAALLQSLHQVREENTQLQSAIDQMTRRRDQLLLIKTRVSGLRTKNISEPNTTHGQPQGMRQNDALQIQPVASHTNNAPIYTSVTTK